MINKLKYILIFIYLILVVSCDDTVSFKAPLDKEYVMYSIVNGESNSQAVFLGKSYDVSGFNPFSNTSDQSIGDAEVSFIINGERYLFQDTLSNQFNNERFSGPMHFYVNHKLPDLTISTIKLNARLKNGKELNAVINVPYFSLFVFEQAEIGIFKKMEKNYILIKWKVKGATTEISFLPRLIIKYEYNNGKERKEMIKVVPKNYILQGNYLPVFPQASKEELILYQKSAVDRAFAEISIADTNKSHYTIKGGAFEVYILDINLNQYYSSINTFEDGFTVKLYEPIVSNINGGLGLFGAYLKRDIPVILDKKYIESFGYKSVE
ncbi:hypothetical protein BMS3Abin04_02063 [bacterium BMS3Abin04]|nr:hypothetical protein BMS3Abin04_02063 [bacterium BMS3Abin04]